MPVKYILFVWKLIFNLLLEGIEMIAFVPINDKLERSSFVSIYVCKSCIGIKFFLHLPVNVKNLNNFSIFPGQRGQWSLSRVVWQYWCDVTSHTCTVADSLSSPANVTLLHTITALIWHSRLCTTSLTCLMTQSLISQTYHSSTGLAL